MASEPGGEVLETGWLARTPERDNLLHDAVCNAAARISLVASSVGGRVNDDEVAIVADTGAPSVFANPVLLKQPLPDPSPLIERLAGHLSPESPALVMSPFPTPDLSEHGLVLLGHPPFMLRPPGTAGSAGSAGGSGNSGSAGEGVTDLEIAEATDAASLAEVERTLIEGFPVAGLARHPSGALLGPSLVGGPFRFFVGRVQGRPVATAAAMVSHGLVQVENVATLADSRGKGFGEAITWAATLADPELPAVLIASDLGRPIYERMGYLSLFRWTLWGYQLGGGR